MTRPLRPLVLAAFLLGVPMQAGRAADAPPSPIKLAKIGKASTALVVLKSRAGYGNAFCVHASGIFVTSERVAREATVDASLTLVLAAALPAQRVVNAKFVHADLGLALLQVDGEKKLAALALGLPDALVELADLYVFGYPCEVVPRAAEIGYPAIAVHRGSVAALQRKTGALHNVKLDGAL